MRGAPSSTADYTLRDQERMRAATRYFAWQYRLAQARLGQRVLEVGCGLGNFTCQLLDRESVIGVDVEPECVTRHSARFAGCAHVESICLDVLSPDFSSLRRYRPDSVACLNVLEHVSDDGRALSHLHAVLPPGGVVVLIVPAFDALYGPIDRLLGHCRRYSKAALIRLARESGFQPRTLRYVNSIGFFGWWFNARVWKREEQSAAQIAAFDRFLVPVLSRAEQWIEPPVGQSIFAVLEKEPA